MSINAVSQSDHRNLPMLLVPELPSLDGSVARNRDAGEELERSAMQGLSKVLRRGLQSKECLT